ncbi:MAG: MerR family transcriptional regulator [Candidatus Marinimicrobia bacterium]|nr:MerR family transcriptional regulator [Candidatus Neomarinimicrobiota bacterium]
MTNTVHPEIKKLYYSISEVSKLTDLKQYVLRYWETEFKQLNPPKNRAGNRTYRQKDIDLILEIKDLLYKRKFTIDGARNELSKERSAKKILVEEPKVISEKYEETIKNIKEELRSILTIIAE